VVVGHESAGIVEEVGENVTLAKPGDHVVVSLLRSCGHCFFCATGAAHMCEAEFALTTQSRLRNKQGQTIQQGIRVAGFAEYAVVDQSQVIQVPPEMPLDEAALLACGVITGLGAVVNTAKVEPNSSVVVIGLGGVGLSAVQGAVLAGAYPLIALDLVESKLAAAKSFGATHAIQAADQEAAQMMVKELTGGRGADYVFVTVGSTAALAQAFNLIRRKGTVVIVGIPEASARFPLAVSQCVWNEQRVIGSSMGSTRLRVDVPRLVSLYQHGQLKLNELISARYPLEQINEAIAAVETGEVLRNVIMF
jgi:S-(hydroxymethyl)glutathione dehydrogenase/alcohol dehydrogenase